MRPKTFLIAAIMLTCAGTSMAQPMHAPSSGVEVVQPWARASAGQTGAAYMMLKNDGDTDDKLIAVSTAAAAKAELHNMTMEGDVMRMRSVDGIPVKAHGSAELKPGGLHVMLMGLKAPLKQGDSIPVTLTFEKAGKVSVQVPVQPAGAAAPAMGGMHMGH
jgi:copper(I)-binding protein